MEGDAMRLRTDHRSSTGNDMRMAIVDATTKLVVNSSLEDISVKEIREEASISRSTFYYHFNDKFDIVQWHYDYVAEHNLFETGRTLTWFQAHYKNTYEVLRKEGLYKSAFESKGYQSLFSYSKRRRIETLKETVTEYKNEKLDQELGFQIYALAESEVASMSRWFKDGQPFDFETLCRYLDGIVPKRLHDLLDDPVSPRLY